jgi:hypothetical protein
MSARRCCEKVGCVRRRRNNRIRMTSVLITYCVLDQSLTQCCSLTTLKVVFQQHRSNPVTGSAQRTPVSTQLKLHTVELELHRLDEPASVYHPKTLAGDLSAAALVLRIQERRSALLGNDTPLKIDSVCRPVLRRGRGRLAVSIASWRRSIV